MSGITWTQEAMLTATDALPDDTMGNAVSIDSSRALVGASGRDEYALESGAAYIFHNADGIWVEESKLIPTSGAQYDRFGHSVALLDDLAFVGAPFVDDLGDATGAVHVYRRAGLQWNEEARLMASDAGARAAFGSSLAAYGGRVAIGAPLTGAVYVFGETGGAWSEEAKLVPSDPENAIGFGNSVSLHQELLIVGASRHDLFGTRAGAAYIFSLSDGVWTENARLFASDADEEMDFGTSVSIASDLAVVGAIDGGNIGGGSPGGSAYWFRKVGTTWVQEGEVAPPVYFHADDFGASVVIDQTNMLIGAPLAPGPDSYTGGAFVFALSGGDCDDNGVFDSCDADCNANAESDTCDIQLATSSDVLPPNGDGIPDECQADCNENDAPDTYDIAIGVSGDCNDNDIPDECDISAGASLDCDSNIVPDECQPDCNQNGQADPCDIADGSSIDCGPDGVPDDCQPDCNLNDVADMCDLSGGASVDANGNGRPDECDPVNDLCQFAAPVCGGVTAFDATGALSDGPAAHLVNECNFDCDGGCDGYDVWFDFTAPSSGTFRIQVSSDSPYLPGLIVYPDCNCPVNVATAVACIPWYDSGEVTFDADARQRYKIQVEAVGAPGALTIERLNAPAEQCIPCVSTWGLAVLSLLLAVAGTLVAASPRRTIRSLWAQSQLDAPELVERRAEVLGQGGFESSGRHRGRIRTVPVAGMDERETEGVKGEPGDQRALFVPGARTVVSLHR
jgi:hypothetical protein